MRIACVQFAPVTGDVENNLNRADAVLSKADPVELESLDLLVLPEMAFTGYNFGSLQHIMPFLEPSVSGISSLWARTTALKYDCTVAVGYPEKVDIAKRWPASPEYYNSLVVVNGDGETVANYRKTFLYSTDESWALEGPGFFGEEVEHLGQVAMGICMDINPWRFEAPWHAFEFAFHILEIEANLVLVSMAWLTREDSKTFTRISDEPDMESLTYWVQRLEPVIRAEKEEEIIVVFCNRCGAEGDALYSGTSAVIGIKEGEVSVYGLLGRGVKEALIVDTDQPPFAKLINHPDTIGDSTYVPPSCGAIPEQRDSVVLFDDNFLIAADKSTELSGEDGSLHEIDVETDQEQGLHRVAVGHLCHPVPSPGERIPQDQIGVAHPNLNDDDDDDDDEWLCQEREQDPVIYGGNVHIDHGGLDGEECDAEMSPILDSPICPSPSPLSARPRLAIDTGPESLSPIVVKPPSDGMPLGHRFTSHHLYTPPLSSGFDKSQAPITRHFQVPASAAMYTPEEPVWPIADISTKIDFKRTPSRTAPSRNSRRAQKVKRSEVRSPTVENAHIRREITSRNQARVRIAEPWSAVEPRRSSTDPYDPFQARSMSAFEAVDAGGDRDVMKPSRLRRPSKFDLDRVDIDQAEDWYRARVTSSIHIAASPSVFQTTFPAHISGEASQVGSLDQQVLNFAAEDLRYEPQFGDQGRSRSIEEVGPFAFKHQEAMPPTLRSSTFPSVASCRAENQPTSRSLDHKSAEASVSAVSSEVLEQMKAFTISENDAHGFRSSRDKSRGRRHGTSKSCGRRSHSVTPEQTARIPLSPYDLRSPMSV